MAHKSTTTKLTSMRKAVNACRDEAFRLLDLEYPALPLNPATKHPYVRWGPYQDLLPADEEVERWFRKWPDAGVCIITTDLIVVDIDRTDASWPEDDEQKMDLHAAPTVNSPRGGTHHYFRRPTGCTYKSSTGKIARSIDIKTGNAIVVCPPTAKADGRKYEWENENWIDSRADQLGEPPPWLIAHLDEAAGNKPTLAESQVMASDIPEGQRDNSLFKVACLLRSTGASEAVIFSATHTKNSELTDPLPDSQVRKISHSAAGYPPDQATQASLRGWAEQDLEKTAADQGSEKFQHRLVHISGRRQDDIVNDALSNVAKASQDPEEYLFSFGPLFAREGGLVFLNTEDSPPRIEPATKHGLIHRINEINEFRSGATGQKVAQQPHYLPGIIQAMGANGFPRLNRVAGTPFFDRNGVLVSRNGYHKKSGTWLDKGGLKFPELDHLDTSIGSVARAAEFFHDLLRDFPFATQADEAIYIGQLFLSMVRELIDGPTMGCAIDASCPGSGKTLLAELIVILSYGGSANISSLDKSEAEVRKRITSSLTAGRPTLIFDNNRGFIDSPALAAMLSSRNWEDRPLGRTELVTVPNLTHLIITGNNLSMSGELADRFGRVRIVPETENPRQRTGFKYDPIQAYLTEKRAEALTHLAVMVQNWINTGMNYSGPVQGTFESYCRVVGGVLEAAGFEGFLANRDEFVSQSAVSDAEWVTLVEKWWGEYRDRPVTAAQLNDICEDLEILGRVRGDTQQSARLGRKLSGQMRERVFNGRMICVTKTGPGHPNRFHLSEVKP